MSTRSMGPKKAYSLFKEFWLQVALIIGVLAGLMRVQWLSEKLQTIIERGVGHDDQGGHFLDPTWSMALAVITIVTVAALLLLSSLWIKSTREGHERRTLAKTVAGSMNAMTQIVNQMYAAEKHPGYRIEKIDHLFEINKKGDAEVTLSYEVSALTEPLHVFSVSIDAHSDANPVRYLADINYRVTDAEKSKEAVYQQYENDLWRKVLCVFFLPRIDPGETRKISISFNWPKMCRRLIKHGEEEFRWEFVAKDRIKELIYEIYIERVGGLFTGSISGQRADSESLSSAASKKGWPGLRYSVTNVPGTGVYSVLLKKR